MNFKCLDYFRVVLVLFFVGSLNVLGFKQCLVRATNQGVSRTNTKKIGNFAGFKKNSFAENLNFAKFLDYQNDKNNIVFRFQTIFANDQKKDTIFYKKRCCQFIIEIFCDGKQPDSKSYDLYNRLHKLPINSESGLPLFIFPQFPEMYSVVSTISHVVFKIVRQAENYLMLNVFVDDYDQVKQMLEILQSDSCLFFSFDGIIFSSEL